MLKNGKATSHILYNNCFNFCFFLLALLFLSCSVPYYSRLDEPKIELSGETLKYIETQLDISNDMINYSGTYKFSKVGDYNNGNWQTHSSNISCSFTGLLRTEAEKTLQLAFTNKNAVFSFQKDNCYSLQLSWETNSNQIYHSVEKTNWLTSEKKVVPKNYYNVKIIGKLHYQLLDPDRKIVVSGYCMGEGAGKGSQIVGFLTRNIPETSLKGAYGIALEAAINMSCLKLVNELRNNQQLAIEDKNFQEKVSLPPSLTLDAKFSEENSIIRNNSIDGGESSIIKILIENKGQGIAFGVGVYNEIEYENIIIPTALEVEDIKPGLTKTLNIPISANLNIVDGTAAVKIYVKEKRGYDAIPVQLQIPVRHLDKPALSITSFTLNDGTSGMASGNGNGIVENGETVEVIAFVKNTGVGASLNTVVNLNSVSPGAEIRQGKARLGTIEPTETRQAKVVLAIPRTYSGSDLRLTFAARDTIGASQITKEHILPMSKLAPVLAFDSRFLDSRGVQVDEVSNGNNYILEIVPRNEGQIAAKSVQANVTASTGVNMSNTFFAVGDIAAGATAAPIRFNFVLPRNYNLGIPQFNLRLSQSEFADVNQKLEIPFRLKSPNLIAREIVTTTDGNADIQQSETVDIDVVVENQGDLDAEGVLADLSFTHTGIDFRERSKTLGRIPAGGQGRARFNFLVKTGAAVGPLVGQLQVHQKDGFPPINKTLNYAISAIGAQIVTVTPTEQPGTAQRVAPVVRANTPPVVFLSVKNLGADGKSYEPYIKLEIQIKDDKPLVAVEPEIRVNGHIQPKEQGLRGIGLEERESKEVDQKLRLFRQVELSEGFNNIEVRIYDADNEMGFEIAQVEYVAQRTDILALVIGVGQYQYSVDPLKYAAADAQSFHDFLRSPEGGGLPLDRIRLLLNKEATRENIIKGMEWLASKAFENDLVIIYLATHGMVDQGELYFVGYNTDPKNILATGIKKSDLDIIQRRLKSNKVVWFADACHSGSMGEEPNVTMRSNRASSTNRLLSEIAKVRNGLAMFLSAQSTEFSQESERWGGGHGVFTYYLLQGLRGQSDRNRDNLITITELFEFVSRQVNEATEGKQSPILYGNYDRALPLSTVK